ncbi:MAG: ABC transporter permease [Alphaproteobacteria bacterium]
MNRDTKPWMRGLLMLWMAVIVLFMYVPISSVMLASVNKARYFRFPIQKFGLNWYQDTFDASITTTLHVTSLYVAGIVAVVATVFGFFGALAFARFNWRGRSIYQKVILLPIFFPQAVLGLALLQWYTTLGIIPTWHTTAFAHLVWIVPIVTLVISIQIYGFDTSMEEAAYDLGASRWQVLREVTIPALAPGLFSGALFSFLLSWGNFPLSAFTSGADSTVPEWLYSKMTVAYTPMIATIGTMSVVGSFILLFGAYFIWVYMRRKRAF